MPTGATGNNSKENMNQNQASQLKEFCTISSVSYSPTKTPGEVQVSIVVMPTASQVFIAGPPLQWDAVNQDWRVVVRFQNTDMDTKMKLFRQVRDIATECKNAGIKLENSLDKAIASAESKGLL